MFTNNHSTKFHSLAVTAHKTQTKKPPPKYNLISFKQTRDSGYRIMDVESTGMRELGRTTWKQHDNINKHFTHC
jgi:hypothetical protein